jgi:hypothetical protein
MFQSILVLLLAVISIELAGMWHEVRGLRREQIKNAAYTLRPEVLAKIKAAKNGETRIRLLSGQVEIAGEVTVTTGLFQPLPVKVEDSLGDPIHIQASDPVPVQIERCRLKAGRATRLFQRWLPTPRLVHPYPDVRFDATHPR